MKKITIEFDEESAEEVFDALKILEKLISRVDTLLDEIDDVQQENWAEIHVKNLRKNLK
tara:strand:- start:1270 stop:1446 length:177 start_codon:yes stop_codon:yes gene_type:complete